MRVVVQDRDPKTFKAVILITRALEEANAGSGCFQGRKIDLKGTRGSEHVLEMLSRS